MSLRHSGPHGALKAAALAPSGAREIVAEYERLNTREAKAAFADRWVGIWSKDLDASWPVLYELLKLIEDDKLYADPRRVGPAAPGGRAAHGKQARYDSFEQYFNDRVRQPFERWAELEQTYHYVSEYAPDLLKKPFGEALAATNTNKDKKTGRFIPADNVRPAGTTGYGNSETYIVRRLKRDRPDLAEQVLSGKTSAHAAGIAAGFIRRTATIPIDDPEAIARTLHRRLSADQLAELRGLL
jgi:hypothetical protein